MPDEWPMSRMRRFKIILFTAARMVVVPLLRLILGMQIEGLENVPRRGPALVVCNHLHNADPVLMVAAFPRPVLFMAKREVFGVPVVRWFARQAGAFPVERGTADRAALRHAERLLAEGMLVGVFPEGTRSTTGALKEPFPGVALIATRSRVPIIPAAIWGTETLPFNGKKGRRGKRKPVRVRIGTPFCLPERAPGERRPNLDELTDLMMAQIARLLPPEYRGVYAERVREPSEPVPVEPIAGQPS